MNTKLNTNSKLLLVVHNCFGILLILTALFLNIFLLDKIGFKSLIIFNTVTYTFASLFFYVWSKVKEKRILWLYRFGMLIELSFLILLITLGNSLTDYYIYIGILYGIGKGTYYYAYNQLTYLFNTLDERMKALGLTNTINLCSNVIVPITLGALITMGSYNLVFIIMAVMVSILILISMKFKLGKLENKPTELLKYAKKVIKKPHLRSIYIIEIFQGFITISLDSIIFPIIIFLTFKSELSLGMITSIFSIISITISYVISKRIVGKYIMKLTAFSLIGNALSSLLLLFPLTKFIIILNKGLSNVFLPIRTYGFTHYGFNIIDIEGLSHYRREHFVIRECFLGIGRVLSFLVILLIIAILGDSLRTYQLLALIITFPSLIIIYHINRIEKHVVKVLKQDK